MHPIMLLALVLVTALALTQVPNLAAAPDGRRVEGGPGLRAAVATPNHPDPVSLIRPPAAAAVATPQNDPYRVSLTLQQPQSGQAPAADPDGSRPTLAFALALTPVRAEPEPAAPSAPRFVDTDTVLFAKDNARLRAAPSTSTEIMAKLTADAPLRAIGRSADGAWWRVTLSGGRIGYVHRTAVSLNRMEKTKPRETPETAVAASPSRPASAQHDQNLQGYVDETMNWLTGAAARGSARVGNRTER